MGYSYDRNGRLACEGCGSADGTRKRVCPHKVTSSSLHGRMELAYCPPPALCKTCYAAEGGARGVHSGCAAGAAAVQAREDGIERRLQAGESFVTSAFGADPDDGVPAGLVGVIFRNAAKAEEYRLVTADEYHAAQERARDVALSDFPDARPWALVGRLARRAEEVSA